MLSKTIIPIKSAVVSSVFLNRKVDIDIFLPPVSNDTKSISLLLINDGQNMEELGLAGILTELYMQKAITPLYCVGIHCGEDRKNEYGTALSQDYKGRGAKAALYTRFVLEELVPFLLQNTGAISFKDTSFAGFSLGGLSALDIVWNNPQQFVKAGVFSGSLWWRKKGLDDGYVEETDRIMHAQINNGNYFPWLKFFFETGTMDETEDRNNNGIIDSIDDTLGLIEALKNKGYRFPGDITYLELQDGRHDISTWAKAMPEFLRWGWGNKL